MARHIQERQRSAYDVRTPPAPIEIVHVFPELLGREKVTVRLHPRPAPDPGLSASKMGGLFLWPTPEPWPTCSALEELSIEEGNLRMMQPGSGGSIDLSPVEAGNALHNDYMIGVLQLRQEDVPEIAFYPGTDLFQLLWCPRSHPEEYGPHCRVFWRRTEDIANPRSFLPEPSQPDQELLPPICALAPERVVEYPPSWELPEELNERIEAWETDGAVEEVSYHFQLSDAPGTKVGGYANPTYGRDVERPCPACGAQMEYLLTVDSGERGATEANGRWDTEPPPIEEYFLIGRGGNLVIFICRRHEEWVIAWTL
jgi:hypothetical protein